MIGRVRGVLAGRQPPHLLIDVHGIGYEIEAPMSTFYVLPPLGSEVTLHTHLVVREDGHTLFGFAHETERVLFRSLLRVNGVGARLALGILSGVSTEEFARCIQERDTGALTRLPGVGRKTAERLIVEMQDRLGDWETAVPEGAGAAAPGGQVRPAAEAVSALVALGYRPQEASRMVRAVDAEGLGSEEIIRRALQSVAP